MLPRHQRNFSELITFPRRLFSVLQPHSRGRDDDDDDHGGRGRGGVAGARDREERRALRVRRRRRGQRQRCRGRDRDGRSGDGRGGHHRPDLVLGQGQEVGEAGEPLSCHGESSIHYGSCYNVTRGSQIFPRKRRKFYTARSVSL